MQRQNVDSEQIDAKSHKNSAPRKQLSHSCLDLVATGFYGPDSLDRVDQSQKNEKLVLAQRILIHSFNADVIIFSSVDCLTDVE